MAALRFAIVCVVVTYLVSTVRAYSSGGPDGACELMRPSHGVAPQSSQAPYTVTANSGTINAGDIVQVTVQGSPAFKGFLIRAQQGGNYVNGQFSTQAGTSLRCGGSGITHASASAKPSVTVTWTAPSNLNTANGPIKFVATVVQQRTILWVQIPSTDIAVGAATGGGASTNSGNTSQMSTAAPPTGGPMNTGTGSNMDDDDDDDDDNSANAMEVGTGVFLTLVVSLYSLFH